MTQITSQKSGRSYDVEHQLYGTRNHVYRLYYGGIYLAGTDKPRMHYDEKVKIQSSMSIEETIEVADIRADQLGIKIID
jgi:hypothetical protein